MNVKKFLAVASLLFVANAFAKIPPAPPADPAVVAAKAEKDKATAEKTKADQARYEDKAVANFQANMKTAGKPIPKPTPIVVAVAPVVVPAPAATVVVKDVKLGAAVKK